MSSRKLTGAQLKKFRSDVARLKAKGLVGKRVDARSQKPTRYMREQVKQYQDVLDGKAKVLTVPKRKDARQFADTNRTKFNKVIVKAKPDETVSYSAKEKDIRITRRVKDKKVTRHIYAESPKSRIKEGQLFVIPIGNTRQRFDTWDDLVLFMEPYETNPKNPYKEWQRYVEIIDVDDAGDDE